MHQNIWQSKLAGYPYAQSLMNNWMTLDHSEDVNWKEYEEALNIYLLSQDTGSSLKRRYELLIESQKCFQDLYEKGDTHLGTRLALVRLYSELGENQAAMNMLGSIIEFMPWLAEPLPENLRLHINRPFISPIASFDHREMQDSLGQWFQEALLETLDKLENSD